jgi:hypothetical protein
VDGAAVTLEDVAYHNVLVAIDPARKLHPGADRTPGAELWAHL